MTDKTRDLLKEHDRALARAKRVEDAKKAAEKRFIAAFVAVRAEKIRPVFERLKSEVEAAGHAVLVRSQDLDKPEISFAVAMKMHGGSRPNISNDQWPHITFKASADSRTVIGYSSTVGDGHGGTSGRFGIFQLDGVTPQFVERAFEDWFGKLMHWATPRVNIRGSDSERHLSGSRRAALGRAGRCRLSSGMEARGAWREP